MKRIVVVLVVATVLLAALLGVRLWSQDRALRGAAGGSGEIEGTEVDLAARIAARIVEIPVVEGQAVKQGDLLVRLDCADAAAARDEARARVASAKAQAGAAEAALAAAHRSRDAAHALASASGASAKALSAQRDAAMRQADRLDSLGTDVAFATRDQLRAQADGLDNQVRAATAQGEASRAQARAAAEQVAAAQAQLAAARSAAAAAEAAASRAELLAGECELRAPLDAVVDQLPFERGELVPAGMPLVRLVDLSRVTATFYLPNAEVGAARPGMEAEVHADAFPGEVFRGRVRTVAARAEFTPRNVQTRTDRDRLVYPVEVELENPEGKLRPGMPVQVLLPGTER